MKTFLATGRLEMSVCLLRLGLRLTGLESSIFQGFQPFILSGLREGLIGIEEEEGKFWMLMEEEGFCFGYDVGLDSFLFRNSKFYLKE
jgi:hypothetical protein